MDPWISQLGSSKEMITRFWSYKAENMRQVIMEPQCCAQWFVKLRDVMFTYLLADRKIPVLVKKRELST
jgi:hypothetical protein